MESSFSMFSLRLLRLGDGVKIEDFESFPGEEFVMSRLFAFGDWKRNGLFMTNRLTMFIIVLPDGLIKSEDLS
jgi:hypothetical protein